MYIEKSLQMFSYSFSVINENNIIKTEAQRCINYTPPLYIVLEMEISILLHQYYTSVIPLSKASQCCVYVI